MGSTKLRLPWNTYQAFLAVVSLALLTSNSRGDEKPSAEQLSIIAKLIRQLGDDDFQTREQASVALRKIGRPATERLQRAEQTSTDAEVKHRIAAIRGLVERDQSRADELHVVGLSRPSKEMHHFASPGDREIRWRAFCALVVKQSSSPEPSPGLRIWEYLSEDVRKDFQNDRKIVATAGPGTKPGGEPIAPRPDTSRIMSTWCKDLERALVSRDFYDPRYFQNVPKNDSLKALADRYDTLTPLETRLLNRKLLEASFPDEVKPCGVELRDLIVNVHIPSGTTSIILALSSYESAHWVIHEEQPGRLQKVFVGGHCRPEISGTQAPTSFYAYERKSQADPSKERTCFQAWHPLDPAYAKMEQRLAELTGMKITTFQGVAFGQEFTVGTKE